jgi:hypothetical protein
MIILRLWIMVSTNMLRVLQHSYEKKTLIFLYYSNFPFIIDRINRRHNGFNFSLTISQTTSSCIFGASLLAMTYHAFSPIKTFNFFSLFTQIWLSLALSTLCSTSFLAHHHGGNWLWKMKIPKIKHFCWLINRDGLPTRMPSTLGVVWLPTPM